MKELRDQWPRVRFLGPDGRSHTHTFDLTALYLSGFVEAIAVRPASRVDGPMKGGGPSLRQAVDLMTVQGAFLRFAHAAVIVTELEASADDAFNAGRIRRARRFCREEDVGEALAALAALGRRFRFHDLVRGAADEARRAFAVWTLIDRGVLLAEEPGAVIDRSWLLRSDSVAEGAR